MCGWRVLVFLLSSVAFTQPKLEFPTFVRGDYRTYPRVVLLNSGIRALITQTHRESSLDVGYRGYGMDLQGVAPDGTSVNIGPFPVMYGGNGDDVIVDAAVDNSGNVWVVGNTSSDDFKLTNPIFTTKMPYKSVAFVLEFNPTMDTLLFATYLGGPARTINSSYSTSATGLALDSSGNAYVGGSTNDPLFPTSAGAYLAALPGILGLTNTYSYVVKISAAGRLVYSTLLGTGGIACTTGSSCIGKTSTAAVTGIAADVTGAATAAETRSYDAGYVSRLSADGTKLVWSTKVQSGSAPYVLALTLAQDAPGNIYLLGTYGSGSPISTLPGIIGNFGLFAMKLAPDGSTVVYSTDLGQSADVVAQGIALDSSGNAYLAGTSSSPQFPTLAGSPNLGADFLLRLDATGTKAQKLFRFPTGVVIAPPRIDATDRLMLLGAQGGLLTIPVSYNFDSPLVVGFANSSSFALNTGMARGTLISLFGYGLGSSQAAQVTISGVSAPVIYSSATQINLIVPFITSDAAFDPAKVQVIQPSSTFTFSAQPIFSIGIFTTDGVYAAALNQDGTVNSAANPAEAGSIVSVFGTGAVWPLDLWNSGALATKAESLVPTPNAFQMSFPANLYYFGAAPGLYIGVFQINAQIYFGGYLQIRKIGALIAASNVARVYVK